ncbi:MAG: TetR/AcrR family transcriptional regulator [Acidimicrobiales bacterium]
MSPRRLSRQESAARTRVRLLDIAEREFLRRGYGATSLDRIAETAGFSKGAVYGNFAGKEELCLAVVDRHYTAQFGEFTQELAAAEQTIEARLAVFAQWHAKMLGDHRWRLLFVEFAAHARQNRQLGKQLAQRDRRVRAAIVALLEQQYSQLGLIPPLPLDQVAVVIMAIAGGIALQRALDPEIPASLLTDAVRVFLTSGGDLAGEPGGGSFLDLQR